MVCAVPVSLMSTYSVLIGAAVMVMRGIPVLGPNCVREGMSIRTPALAEVAT